MNFESMNNQDLEYELYTLSKHIKWCSSLQLEIVRELMKRKNIK